MKVQLFHIGYSEDTSQSPPEGFSPPDNRANERPDWFEYWPIRCSLKRILEGIQENDFVGFFSPRFSEKTGLDASMLRGFAQRHGTEHDILLFSPQPDIAAFFANVFLGEDFFNPGFLSSAQAALSEIGLEVDLSGLITDSRNTVFSNYFLARPAFWRSWFAICEKIFLLAEAEEVCPPSLHKARSEIRARLNHPTAYGNGAQVKVFLIERIASLMLASSVPQPWRAKAWEPFKLAWSVHFSHAQGEAVLCDALKIAFQATQFDAFAARYEALRTAVLKRLLEQLEQPSAA